MFIELQITAITLAFIAAILMIKKHKLSWLFGALCSTFLAYIFIKNQLYPQYILQIIYICLSIVGLFFWRNGKPKDKDVLNISNKYNLALLLISVVVSEIIVYAVQFYNNSIEYLTVLSSVLLLCDCIMQIFKYINGFIFAFLGNFLMTIININHHIYIIAILSLCFTIMPIVGYIRWKKYIT